MLCIEGRTLPPTPTLEAVTLGERVRGAVRTPHHDAHRRAGVHGIVRTGPGVNRTGCAPSGGEVRCIVHNSSRRAPSVCAGAPRTRVSGARGARPYPARWLYDPPVGQTPAQKAAKAARGQQPKKRPGEAQLEAIKQAQAAKKKAGGGKPAAKKTAAKKAVPLPRGSVRAAHPGTCPACFKDYGKGEVITKVGESWGHPGCAPRQVSAAEREFAQNKAAIERGETFRSRKPSDWRLGSSPSSTRPAR
jgi:hypothetical protein